MGAPGSLQSTKPDLYYTRAEVDALIASIAGASRAAMPIGTMAAFAGTTPPANFLFAQGQLVSRVQYAALFAVIGVAFGAGGSDNATFALPDTRGRTLYGLGGIDNTTVWSLGQKRGANSAALDAESLAHTHTLGRFVGRYDGVYFLTTDNAVAGSARALPGVDAGRKYKDLTDTDLTGEFIGTSPSQISNPKPVPTISPGLGINVIIKVQ